MRVLAALGLALVGVGAHGAAAWQVTRYAGASAGLLAFLGACHLAGAVAAAEALRLRAPDPTAARSWHRLGLALALLFPILGALGVAWLVLLPPRPKARTEQGETAEVARARAMDQARARDRDAQVVGADVQSIVDALHDPDPALRLGAMDALREMKGPEAVRLLQRSLRNTLFDVRFRAVEALGNISQRYSDDIAAASAKVDASPDDADAHLTLADLYAEYRSLNVEDSVMQSYLLAQSEVHYRRAVELGRGEKEVLLKLSQALVELDRHGDARAVLELRPELAGDPEVLLARARVEFARGRVEAVRTACRQALRSGRAIPEELEPAVHYWATQR